VSDDRVIRTAIMMTGCLGWFLTELKPLDKFRCHLAGTLVGSSNTLC